MDKLINHLVSLGYVRADEEEAWNLYENNFICKENLVRINCHTECKLVLDGNLFANTTVTFGYYEFCGDFSHLIIGIQF